MWASPEFWHAVGHAIDPIKIACPHAQRLVKKARYAACGSPNAPKLDELLDVLRRDPRTTSEARRQALRLIVELEDSDIAIDVELVINLTRPFLEWEIDAAIADMRVW